jgi:hypothetical protein
VTIWHGIVRNEANRVILANSDYEVTGIKLPYFDASYVFTGAVWPEFATSVDEFSSIYSSSLDLPTQLRTTAMIADVSVYELLVKEYPSTRLALMCRRCFGRRNGQIPHTEISHQVLVANEQTLCYYEFNEEVKYLKVCGRGESVYVLGNRLVMQELLLAECVDSCGNKIAMELLPGQSGTPVFDRNCCIHSFIKSQIEHTNDEGSGEESRYVALTPVHAVCKQLAHILGLREGDDKFFQYVTITSDDINLYNQSHVEVDSLSTPAGEAWINELMKCLLDDAEALLKRCLNSTHSILEVDIKSILSCYFSSKDSVVDAFEKVYAFATFKFYDLSVDDELSISWKEISVRSLALSLKWQAAEIAAGKLEVNQKFTRNSPLDIIKCISDNDAIKGKVLDVENKLSVSPLFSLNKFIQVDNSYLLATKQTREKVISACDDIIEGKDFSLLQVDVSHVLLSLILESQKILTTRYKEFLTQHSIFIDEIKKSKKSANLADSLCVYLYFSTQRGEIHEVHREQLSKSLFREMNLLRELVDSLLQIFQTSVEAVSSHARLCKTCLSRVADGISDTSNMKEGVLQLVNEWEEIESSIQNFITGIEAYSLEIAGTLI